MVVVVVVVVVWVVWVVWVRGFLGGWKRVEGGVGLGVV